MNPLETACQYHCPRQEAGVVTGYSDLTGQYCTSSAGCPVYQALLKQQAQPVVAQPSGPL